MWLGPPQANVVGPLSPADPEHLGRLTLGRVAEEGGPGTSDVSSPCLVGLEELGEDLWGFGVHWACEETQGKRGG